MYKLSFLGILISGLLIAGTAKADISPVYSETSLDDANAQCTSAGGYATGTTMETSTATSNVFYIAACARPDGSGGTTYTPSWSASSMDDANNRCAAASYTTGLAGGFAVGQGLSVQANTTDIYILICYKQ